jgi:cellulose synthase/poly-beta-1,6-N-acetylglucosamine synthase-like glycosyltransferase
MLVLSPGARQVRGVVSIIVPLKEDQGYLTGCLQACRDLGQADAEIIVLPDRRLAGSFAPNVRIHPTGNLSPSAKRNEGARLARGEFLAFIDDDTRPLPGWLEAALPHFDDPNVAAVGGPAVTPPDDPFTAQVSGAAYESWLLSGPARHRYCPMAPKNVDDFPSCNLIVRKKTFEELGGFQTHLWPGEDTAFCLALVEKGFRIPYEPGAVIEHHRRPKLKRHFLQVARYGRQRGYFARRYPRTSLRWTYFVPSLFTAALALAGTAAAAGSRIALGFLAAGGAVYLGLALLSLGRRQFSLLALAVPVIFLSHLIYGICFIAGLLGKAPEPLRSASPKGSP